MFSLTRQDTFVIKGIAICAMLLHHLYGLCPEGVEPYTGVLHWVGLLGKVCVALFLFCSGYGLASNYRPVSILDDIKFIGRRLTKFYLNYWIIFFIFVPITIYVFHRPLSEAYGNSDLPLHFMMDIFGFQGFNSYNDTWWYNLLIILLYFLFPLIHRLVRIKPWMAICWGMLLMRLSTRMPINPVEIFTFQFPFVLGVVWKFYEGEANHMVLDSKHIAPTICISLLFFIVTVIVRMYPLIPHWSALRIDGFVACAVVLCVITILRRCEHLMIGFAFLGKHSMNIYMIHTFFNAYWHPEWLHTSAWMREGVNFIILMTICLLISMVIEYFKEEIGIYRLIKLINEKLYDPKPI